MTKTPIEITALSHEGRGIAHRDGKTLFIEGGLPTEEVTFNYGKRHRHFDEGKVVDIVRPSAERVMPACPHYGVCGGCSQQHMNHNLQVQHKQNVLIESLQHIGKLTPPTILSPLLGPEWGYRHKARLGVKYVEKKEKLLVGFREKQGRFLADLNACEILHPGVGKRFAELQQLVMSLEKYRAIPQIEVAIGDEEIALVFRHMEALPDSDLEKLKLFAHEQNIKIYLQPGGNETVHLLAPEGASEELFYRLSEFDLTLYFKPLDFTQINPVINRQLVSRAIELLEIKSTDRIIDFFCGLGNFTLPMAHFAQEVVGVEGSMEMVERASSNAARNGIHNTKFYAANLMGDISSASWQGHYDKILLDPPRTGALELIQAFPFKAKRVVYVSCNPATLARDAAVLVQQHGYKLVSAGIMDMFPHTSHVESIAVFSK